MRPRDIGLGLVAAVVALVCIRLGVWQLDRLGERRARNAEIRRARADPAIAITGRGIPADSARQRRLLARGVLDYAHERVWPARSYRGAPGVHLITPLRLEDGAGLLVDRGWVPSPDARQVDRGALREPAETVEVRGLGAVPPRGRGDVDPRALAESLPYPVLPFLVQWSPGGEEAGRLPVRMAPPALDDGPHLMYAVQWFSFAAIAVVGTAALLKRPAKSS